MNRPSAEKARREKEANGDADEDLSRAAAAAVAALTAAPDANARKIKHEFTGGSDAL